MGWEGASAEHKPGQALKMASTAPTNWRISTHLEAIPFEYPRHAPQALHPVANIKMPLEHKALDSFEALGTQYTTMVQP